jgi:hypothetical protein
LSLEISDSTARLDAASIGRVSLQCARRWLLFVDAEEESVQECHN